MGDNGFSIAVESQGGGNRIFGDHDNGFGNGIVVPGHVNFALCGNQPRFLIDDCESPATFHGNRKSPLVIGVHTAILRMVVNGDHHTRQGQLVDIMDRACDERKSFGIISINGGIRRYQILISFTVRSFGLGFGFAGHLNHKPGIRRACRSADGDGVQGGVFRGDFGGSLYRDRADSVINMGAIRPQRCPA